jgi:ubiquinone/menaquinone biosynthesis C-methylase UbiE
MKRRPEPEVMDQHGEALAYAQADFSGVNQAFVDRLLELAGGIASARALDLGSGPADIPIRLVRARPAWHVTAVDASEAMLQIARKAVGEAGLADRVELVLADAKATALPAGKFDVLFANSILHHLSDVEAFWREFKRLAAPEAWCFLRDLARPGSEQAAREIVALHAGGETPVLQEEYYRSLLSAYTPQEVRRQLGRAGLESLTVKMVTDRHMDVYGKLP